MPRCRSILLKGIYFSLTSCRLQHPRKKNWTNGAGGSLALTNSSVAFEQLAEVRDNIADPIEGIAQRPASGDLVKISVFDLDGDRAGADLLADIWVNTRSARAFR